MTNPERSAQLAAEYEMRRLLREKRELEERSMHAVRWGHVLAVLETLGIDATELRDCLNELP